MSYIFSPHWIWVTVSAVAFLILAYFVEHPSWVAPADLAFLSIDPENMNAKRDILFMAELLAWLTVMLTQFIMMAALREVRTDSDKADGKNQLPWIALDIFILIGILSYHTHMVVNLDEEFFPRAMLAVFSLIMFRQILLSLIFTGKHIVVDLIQSLEADEVTENYFLLGRNTRRRTALAVSVLFLIAVSLIVWSPSLLPAGISPQYIAIGVAVSVTLPSILLSFYVQQRMVSLFDKGLAPLEKEITRATANGSARKDELERIKILIEVRAEFNKVSSLPWLTAAFSILQVAVAVATIFATF